MRFFLINLIVIGCTLFDFHSAAYACTDFRLTAKDKTIIITRSMEFALDLKSNLRTSPRTRVFTMTAPNGKEGLSWKAKYGYAYLDGLNIDAAIDGINEKGLSFGALFLPDLAQYQNVPRGEEKKSLPYINIGDWILGNFETVAQVKNALSQIYVCNHTITGLQNTFFPLHFSIYDATGAGIVVEYVQGKVKIYDNKIGVLTNSPTYDWHITNLNNYVNLLPKNPAPTLLNGIVFAATGQGFGMIGLPGDISPPSRFVKIATQIRVVMPVETSTDLLNLAEHIINNVDIPRGLAREPKNKNYSNEITQWVVFKDVTHKVLYFRTYQNLVLRGLPLDKIDFSPNAKLLKMPLTSSTPIQDVTAQLIHSGAHS
ncbi:MAG: linear amide C-N hydrolase [Gammaproteobacteria bacterium]|nr:linear amide C-N hydrolase [Gammaproteobacteria bacterium]